MLIACVSLYVCPAFIGMTAVICTYPLDVIRARLAFQVTGEHRYTGIGNAFQTIYLKVQERERSLYKNCFAMLFFLFNCVSSSQEGGIPGFYRGLIPTIIGMAPYAGNYYSFYWLFRTVFFFLFEVDSAVSGCVVDDIQSSIVQLTSHAK